MPKNKRINDYEIVPRKLKNKLTKYFNELDKDHLFKRDYRSWNNFVLICGTILYKQFENKYYNWGVYNYCKLSRNYWNKVIGSHYYNYLDFLLSNDIIERKWFGVFGYRIHPELFDNDYNIIKYKNDVISSVVDGIIESNNQVILKRIGFDPNHITLKKKDAISWLKKNAHTIVDNNVSIDYHNNLPEDLTMEFTKIDKKGKTTNHYSISKAKEISLKENLDLLHYKSKNILAIKNDFIADTIKTFTQHYLWRISSFAPEKFNFSRNKITRRVYSQLTSLPSHLLQFVRIHNKFVIQADLKCSQFTIFAYLINLYINKVEILNLFKNKKSKQFITNLYKIFDEFKDSIPASGVTHNDDLYDDEQNDVYSFLDHVFNHDFYQLLRVNLNLPEREHAKLWAFTIVFGKPETNSIVKQQMKSLYPTVINIIDTFKRKYESNDFAVGLQIVEAELIIDNIWKEAKKNGITSFTRHDSILFPFDKQLEIKNIIEKMKHNFRFVGNFKFEVFNEEEINKYIFENTDYVESINEVDMLDLHSHFEVFKSYKNEKHPFTNCDEDDVALMFKLIDIGEHQNYDQINMKLIELIVDLPFLDNTREKNILLDEIHYHKEGLTFYQDETIIVIKELIDLFTEYKDDIYVR